MATKNAAEQAMEFAQTTLARAPVIVLGSGASAAHGVPGMWALAEHLLALVPPAVGTEGNTEWDAFCANLKAGQDLEMALGGVSLPEAQTVYVVEQTRRFLLASDLKAFQALLQNRRNFPLTRLYRHLFSSTHRTVDVVTPNYDRLAEYAADAAEIAYFTGFTQGHLQTRAKIPQVRAQKDAQRLVRIWKVHGSLDWFKDSAHQIVGAQMCIDTPPGYTPLMVTPGREKYRLTYGEPFRTIFACSDAAMANARSFFCVGYGFNDTHVQEKLVERCEADEVPIVIVTQSLTPTTKAFLAAGRCRKYLAIEQAGNGARIVTHEIPLGFDYPDAPIWRLDAFLNFTLGDA